MNLFSMFAVLPILGFFAQQPEEKPIQIFLSHGKLIAGHHVHKGDTLRWKATDPKITTFWIKFTDTNFCQDVPDGVIESNAQQEAACTVTREIEQEAPYRIYQADPRKKRPPTPPPTQFVWSCKFC